MELKQLFTFAAACSLALSVSAQDRVHYTGTELSNPCLLYTSDAADE